MKGNNIITINGRSFDATTGKTIESTPHKPVTSTSPHRPLRAFNDIAPVKRKQPQAVKISTPHQQTQRQHAAAKAIHQRPQKSQTLMRSVIKKPQQPASDPSPKTLTESAAHYRRSPAITKFSTITPDNNVAPITKAVHKVADTQKMPSTHPIVTKALERQVPEKPQPVQSPKELKEMLIKERLAEVEENTQHTTKERKGLFKGRSKLASVLTSTLAVLLLGGYLTYINLPNISMRVAATRAGISANFPNYKPEGYNFDGPITYSPGEVAINFKSGSSKGKFTIKQKSSTWDSQAVLDNYVSKQSEAYLTYQERGLTIYSFDNKAAWVNGGLLYTIEGDAALTSEQVLRIATSM